MVKDFNIVLDLSYMPKGHTGHLVGSQEIIDALKKIYDHLKFKNILQFGFNTGWSTALFLELFDGVTMTSIEIAETDDAVRGVNIIEERFPGRHHIHWGDSKDVASRFYKGEIAKQDFDCAFIDGGHFPDIVKSDIDLSSWLGIKNFIFDDGQHPNIAPAITDDKSLVLQRSFDYDVLKWKNRGYVWKNRTATLDHYLKN